MALLDRCDELLEKLFCPVNKRIREEPIHVAIFFRYLASLEFASFFGFAFAP
jgi:hypothetical protein